MSAQDPNRIELGSAELPEVLRTLAGVLPQFEGADLEGQLQTFDAFLGILAPSVRPEVAGLFREAAAKARTPAARSRIESAAESVARGERAAQPYDHDQAMRSYQESFRETNPPPAIMSDDDDDESDVSRLDPPLNAEIPFREKMKRRAILMEIGGFRPATNPDASWFGKVCLGLPDEPWPMTADDRPMGPLAQINVKELPFRPPGLAYIQLVTVFLDFKGFSEGDSSDSVFCIRTYSSLRALVPLVIPVGIQSTCKALPMRPKIIEEDYPVYDDISGIIPDDIADSYEEDFDNTEGFKLGGWPSLIQGEIEWNVKKGNTSLPAFVFQIDSTEKGGWSWGDDGIAYFGRGTVPGYEDQWYFAWQGL